MLLREGYFTMFPIRNISLSEEQLHEYQLCCANVSINVGHSYLLKYSNLIVIAPHI